jgi:hypothetical protein
VSGDDGSEQGYQPENVQTGFGTDVGVGQATFSGLVNPAGAPVLARIEFGPTTSYGSSTAPEFLAASETLTGISATVTALPSGTIHFRMVATSDFGTFAGSDATVQIPASPTPTGAGGGFKIASHITSPHGNLKARKLHAIKGTASATLGIATVLVAVVKSESARRRRS